MNDGKEPNKGFPLASGVWLASRPGITIQIEMPDVQRLSITILFATDLPFEMFPFSHGFQPLILDRLRPRFLR